MIIPSATLAKDYWHVYSNDAAFDRGYDPEPPTDADEREQWQLKADAWTERWRKALEENTLDKLPLLSGQKPTRWKLRHLRGAVDMHMRDHVEEHRHQSAFAVQSLYRACQLALADVKDAALPDGREFKLRHAADSRTGFIEVSEDVMQQLEAVDSNSLVYELGLRVVTQMYLSKN